MLNALRDLISQMIQMRLQKLNNGSSPRGERGGERRELGSASLAFL
jgi:hypothetical protein